MAALLKKMRNDISNDRRALRAKLGASKNPELRSALVTLGKVAGKRETSMSVWYNEATVTIQVAELQSFKTGPLPALLEKLIDAGVEFTHSSDWAESGNRDYMGRLGPVQVRVAAYLAREAKECMVKIVGEKTETRPVYELVCS